MRETKKFIKEEKLNEFRTTLQDHILYVIICDSHNIKKKSKPLKHKPEDSKQEGIIVTNADDNIP